MQKIVKDQIIFVEKPQMSVVPLALSAASLFFLMLGAASIFYLQQPIQQVQNLQGDASTSTGQVEIGAKLVTGAIYAPGQSSTPTITIDANNVQLSSIQLTGKVTANTEVPTITALSGMLVTQQELEQVSDGYLFTIALTPGSTTPAFGDQPLDLVRFSLPLRGPGQVSFSFDPLRSQALVANTNPPQDQLRTPGVFGYTVAAASSPTPSPSPSPSPTPSPSPSPTVPTNDDFSLRSDRLTITYLTDDSSRTVVAANALRPYTNYIARIQYTIQNALKGASAVTQPVTAAVVINGQGNSYREQTVAYNSLTSQGEGAAMTIETRFSTQPNNTLQITVDAPRRYTETNEGNNVLLYTFPATANSSTTNTTTGANRTCNQYCADSTECASGYTCFYNQCRRPDNPDSSSCGIPSATVIASVAKSCNVSCSNNKECGINLRCYDNACRLATNPSSLSCSPATVALVSSIPPKGPSKGDVITQPSASPTVNSTRSASQSATGAGRLASPTPRPTASPSTQANGLLPSGTTPKDASLLTQFSDVLARITRALQGVGISLPLIAVGLGIALFILALLFAILGRLSRGPAPKVVRATPVPPATKSEQELQQKINDLRKEQQVDWQQRPAAQPRTPQQPLAQTQSSLQPRTAPLSQGVATHTSAAPTMMSRLQERGVLDKNIQEKLPPARTS